MWGLNNETPLQAERTWVRDGSGAEVWVVAAKATFTLQSDGTAIPAEDPEPVHLAPIYNGEAGASSLGRESDVMLGKAATDVILEGFAYPQHSDHPVVDVALEVGPLTKIVRVYGNRRWGKSPFGLRLSQPEPFDRIPLAFENAFGGSFEPGEKGKGAAFAQNPVGKGFARGPKDVDGLAPPNLENPADLITHWGDRPAPACFGPIARDWEPRQSMAGTYDETWMQERRPLLPLDYNPGFSQWVPPNQQVQGFLKGGEQVRISNACADGEWRFQLPKVFLGFQTRFKHKTEHHRADLHTIILAPEQRKLVMTWQTHLECHPQTYELLETTLFEKQKMPLVGAF